MRKSDFVPTTGNNAIPDMMAEYLPPLIKVYYQADKVNEYFDKTLELLLQNMGYELSGSGFDLQTSTRDLEFLLRGSESASEGNLTED